MGGLSLTVGAAAAGRRTSCRLLSPPLPSTLAPPRISEGGEGEEEAESLDADASAMGAGGLSLNASAVAAVEQRRLSTSRALDLSLSFIPPLDDDLAPVAAAETSTLVVMPPEEQLVPPGSPKGIDKIAGDLTAACLEFLPISDLTARAGGPASVCRAWATAALYAQARVFSEFEDAFADSSSGGGSKQKGSGRGLPAAPPRADLMVAWGQVAQRFPYGQFLSDGAYKSVYRVWAADEGRVEALSVMDVTAITATGNAAILAQELRASILMSALVRHKICPNHVETYGVLRTKHAPRDLWDCGSEEFRALCANDTAARRPSAKAPSRSALAKGDYQLIRMELCRHGDLEGYLRRQPDGLVPAGVARLLLFQMCFALYAARDTHAMRHYDVKLLNFLLADFHDTNSSSSSSVLQENRQQRQQQRAGGKAGGKGSSSVMVRYGLGPHVYRLPLPKEQALCVKLADFGTADLVEETLGQPVGLDQFTTLENTPVDFLVDGDRATQGYAADAFSLGLSVLHLFTGSAPYEEVMEEVQCPKELRDALAKAWSQPAYSVLRRVIDASVMDDEEEEEEEEDATLFHTFYRFLVLLGLPSQEDMLAFPGSNSGSGSKLNPVWKAVTSLIGPGPAAAFSTTEDASASVGATVRKTTRARAAAGAAAAAPMSAARPASKAAAAKERVTARFWADHGRFGLRRGTHPLIARGRARLQALPGAEALLLALLDYQPERRPTMHAALTSQVFACLREGAAGDDEAMETEEAAVAAVGSDGLSYMAYFREPHQQHQHQQALPPLREDI